MVKSMLTTHYGFRKTIMNGLKDYNLSPAAPRIMYYLMHNEGCLQKDIASHCFVESATLSSVLSNMEKQHLIERRRTSEDKRAYNIYPAKGAKKIYDAVSEQYDKALEIALDGFSEEEAATFKSYLLRTDNNFKKARER